MHTVFRTTRLCVLGSLVLVSLIFGLSSLPEDLQPTAMLVAVQGDVSVSIQGGSPSAGIVGFVLHEGDSIRTRAGANATVELSDRSTLELAENTAVTISVLLADAQSGTSRSDLDLWWGSVRSVLPSGARSSESSSISVQTSNARTDVEAPSEGTVPSDSEVIYDPSGNTTTAIAHKFDVVMTNLLTEESLLIPQGTIGIAQADTIQQVAMTITFPPGDDSLEELIRQQGAEQGSIKAKLDQIALILQQIKNKKIIIEGHTDNIGSASENMALGQRRADGVKTYFVQEHGIVSERLESISYGDSRPVATNETEEGRAENRRVEVH